MYDVLQVSRYLAIFTRNKYLKWGSNAYKIPDTEKNKNKILQKYSVISEISRFHFTYSLRMKTNVSASTNQTTLRNVHTNQDSFHGDISRRVFPCRTQNPRSPWRQRWGLESKVTRICLTNCAVRPALFPPPTTPRTDPHPERRLSWSCDSTHDARSVKTPD